MLACAFSAIARCVYVCGVYPHAHVPSCVCVCFIAIAIAFRHVVG